MLGCRNPCRLLTGSTWKSTLSLGSILTYAHEVAAGCRTRFRSEALAGIFPGITRLRLRQATQRTKRSKTQRKLLNFGLSRQQSICLPAQKSSKLRSRERALPGLHGPTSHSHLAQTWFCAGKPKRKPSKDIDGQTERSKSAGAHDPDMSRLWGAHAARVFGFGGSPKRTLSIFSRLSICTAFSGCIISGLRCIIKAIRIVGRALCLPLLRDNDANCTASPPWMFRCQRLPIPRDASSRFRRNVFARREFRGRPIGPRYLSQRRSLRPNVWS